MSLPAHATGGSSEAEEKWRLFKYTQMSERASGTYPDLAELHLDLLGHHVSPVLLTQEVPEDSANQSIHPSHGFLLWPRATG